MIEKDILFIYGAGRSGTTLLNHLIRDNFDVGLCAEAHWLRDIAKKNKKLRPVPRENLKVLLKKWIQTESMFLHLKSRLPIELSINIDLDPDKIMHLISENTFAGLAYGVFRHVANEMGKELVGNKLPDYWMVLDTLLDWFPRAKFIHVYRDGRDMAVSLLSRSWGERSYYMAAKKWVEVLDKTDAFKKRVAPTQFLEIRYEDLLSNPPDVFQVLEIFLGVYPTTEKGCANGVTLEKIDRANSAKWKTNMSNSQLNEFEFVSGDWIEKLGYERQISNPKVPNWRKAYYEFDELLRKAGVRRKSL